MHLAAIEAPLRHAAGTASFAAGTDAATAAAAAAAAETTASVESLRRARSCACEGAALGGEGGTKHGQPVQAARAPEAAGPGFHCAAAPTSAAATAPTVAVRTFTTVPRTTSAASVTAVAAHLVTAALTRSSGEVQGFAEAGRRA